MHEVALLKAEAKELRETNATLSKRRKAKKNISGMEDRLQHKMQGI